MNQNSMKRKQWYQRATIRSVIMYVVLMVVIELGMYAVSKFGGLSEANARQLDTAQPWVVLALSVLFLWFYTRAIVKQYRKPTDLLSEYLANSATIHFELRRVENDFRVHWVSQNAEKLLGYSLDEIKSVNWWYNNLHPADRSSVVKKALRGLDEPEFVYEYRFRHADGHYIWIRDQLRHDDPSGKRIRGSWINISNDFSVPDDSLYTDAMNQVKVGLAELTPNNKLSLVDDAFASIIGLSPEQAQDLRLEDILTPISDNINGGHFPANETIEVIGRRPDHSRFKAQLLIRPCPRNEHVIACLADISLVEQQRQALHNAAFFEELSGLPNLRSLHLHFKSLIDELPEDRLAALITVNINQFHHINHRYGSLVGDKTLQRVAKRIKAALPFGSKLYAAGGDEFVVLINNITEYIDIQVITDNILAVFRDKFIIDNNAQFYLTCSSGSSIYPLDGYDSDQLLAQARSAMIQSRAETTTISSGSQQQSAQPSHFHLQLAEDIKSTTLHQELEVYYQPIFNDAKNIIGAEALLRWNHPEFGLLSPALFLHHAEEAEKLADIGLWVLDEVVLQLNKWIANNSPLNYVSINLSAPQLTSTWIHKLREHYDRDPGLVTHLGIELSESVLNEPDLQVQNAIKALSELGLDIIIDDFGTGFASLTYLAEYPIDQIKIDRRFIANLVSSEKTQRIVESMMTFARAAGVEVVAEGVESEEQFELIRKMGCLKWQGHLIHPAKPVDELNELD